MIITKLSGGLGNQMFQYAAGKSLASRHNTDFFLDTMEYDKWTIRKKARAFELSLFGLKNRIKPDFFLFNQFNSNYTIAHSTKYVQPHVHFDSHFYELPDHTHLIGVWQSEQYFKDIRSALINDFSFARHLNPDRYYQNMLDKIGATRAVSIHVRRGDYVSNPEFNKVHGVTSTSYYQKSIECIQEKERNVHFFIFSDDMEWVKSNLDIPAPFEFVRGKMGQSAIFDMWMMSQCRHNIIANSSFSWWGAWLNTHADKVVICPRNWFADKQYDSRDVAPPDWIKI